MYATLLLLAALAPAGLEQAAPPAPTATSSAPPAQPAQPAPGPVSPPKADQPPAQAADQKPASPAPAGTQPIPPAAANAGQGYPARTLRATATRGTATIQVNLLPNTGKQDVRAGLLESVSSPDYKVVPDLNVITDFAVKEPTVRPIDVEVGGLVPFGEMTVPILYQGKQVETVRFLKPGLIVRPPAEGPTVADEEVGEVLLVLENASAEEYPRVGSACAFRTWTCATPWATSPRRCARTRLPAKGDGGPASSTSWAGFSAVPGCHTR